MEAPKSLSNIVERIRSWIPGRVGVEAPASTQAMTRAFWMPDHSCRFCFECESPFNLFNRRHHCRICGKVFCGKCSLNTIPASVEEGVPAEEGERVRVCNYCYNRREQDSIPLNGLTPTLTPSSSGRSLASSGFGAGASVVPISPQQNIPGGSSDRPTFLWDEALDASSDQNTMRTHQGGSRVLGSMSPRAVDQPPSPYRFDNRSDEDDDEDETQQDELSELQDNQDDYEDDSGMEQVQDPADSERKSDSILYSSQSSISNNPPSEDGSESIKTNDGKSSSEGLEEPGDDDTPMYEGAITVPEITQVDYESNLLIWEPPLAGDDQDDKEDEPGDDDDDDDDYDEGGAWGVQQSPGSVSSVDIKKDKTASDEHKKAMRTQVAGHFRNLVAQLLQQANIDFGDPDSPENWLDIVSNISWHAATLVKPDTSKGGGMDPLLYVKVKCIATGKPSDSVVVEGIVCRKGVAHKRMISRYKNPRLLLLGGALEYQRVSNTLSSLDILLQQEREHLSMTVARIEAHRPNVLLVEKSVSRSAQDILLNKEITLVYNVKRPLLERIARCVGGQVIPSPDTLVAPKAALHCDLFHVEKFVEEHGSAGYGGKQLTKFLMFFEGCPKPLGCTVLLKGANGDYLKKVKQVMQFAVFSAYHLALETSFLMDEGATIPELPSRSQMSIPIPNKHSSSDRYMSSVPGFTIPVPGQVQGPRAGQLSNLSVSPLPSRANSIGTSTGFNNLENSSMATNVVPFSASSSCVSSATNSPGTSPAQTTFGFQSGVSRTSSIGGTSTTTYHRISNGVYAGGQSWQGVSGLSVSLKRGSPDDNPSGPVNTEGVNLGDGDGSLAFEVKALEVNSVSGPSNTSNSDQTVTTTARMVSKGTVREGGDEHHIVPEEVQAHLQVLIQDPWQSEMQLSKEDFPPSPSDHQSILVQLSSHCLTKQKVCKEPHFLRIQYYGNADKPLGRFLRDSLFGTSNPCGKCEEPGDAHVHCFTHRQGSLTISVRRLKPEMALTGERDGRIWMWHRCLRCPPVHGVPPATPRVVMSDAAWGLSFGKFLELSFSNHPAASRVAACGHSLHRDCLRFYGFGRMVACFRYAQINLHSVYLPPLRVEFNCPQQQEWLQKEVDEVAILVLMNHRLEVAALANLVFVEVVNRLRDLGEKIAGSSALYGSSTALDSKRRVMALEALLQKHKASFQEDLERAAPSVRYPGQPLADILELNLLRRKLFIQSVKWDSRLEYLASKSLPPRKRATGSMDETSFLSPKDINVGNGNIKLPESQEAERDSSSSDVLGSHLQRVPNNMDFVSQDNIGLSPSEQNPVEVETNETQLADLEHDHVSGDVNDNHGSLGSEDIPDANGLDVRLDTDNLSLAVEELLDIIDLNPRKGHLVSKSLILDPDLTSNEEDGGTEAAGDRDGHNLVEVDAAVRRLIPSIFSEGDITARRALSEGNFPLLADLSDTLDATWTGEGGSGEASSQEVLEKVSSGEVSGEKLSDSNEDGLDVELEGSGVELVSAYQTMSDTNPQEDAVPTAITSDAMLSVPPSPASSESSEDLPEGWMMGPPFKTYSRSSSSLFPNFSPRSGQLGGDGGARVLLTPGHDDVVVAVYDEEPTTIIAYAISTEEHHVHVTDILVEKEKVKEKDQEKDSDRLNTEQVLFHPLQSSDVLGESDVTVRESFGGSNDPSASRTEAGIENPLTSRQASQMAKKTINFVDETPNGKVKFQVICYFAKQFDALRKKCCRGNTEYIRSLSHCKKWGAQGGKSNVFFAKTADDRFVVKQVTRTELNSFSQFAPDYFKYLFEALTAGNPTCLAKILGVYEVKTIKGGKETKMDLLVMENLLYGKHITRLYDLKGSKRSRYNSDSTGKNQVLLDENLREAMPTNPIFVGSKAKRLLERAVWNDTHFLSAVFVMDYSLLVGVDEDRQELVVGIIDFIRQYTWDKHLETWVKASGFLGGPKNAPPTVISPIQYKKRFRQAMKDYFLMVPDQWIPPPQLTVSEVLNTAEEGSLTPVMKGEDGPDDPETPNYISSH